MVFCFYTAQDIPTQWILATILAGKSKLDNVNGTSVDLKLHFCSLDALNECCTEHYRTLAYLSMR